MANTTELEKYEVLEKIGHGSFGIIRKVKRQSDGLILCRKEINYIKMSAKEREQLHAEFSILNSLKHPNIVGYYHREHLKSSQDLHLYMEYCGGGDLSKVIEKLQLNNQFADEDYVWSIFSQIITALYRCHYGVDPPAVGKSCMGGGTMVKASGLRGKNQVMILHRDLKPENIFLGADNSVKLGDFGLSKLMQSHDFASTYVGTPFYMSPEICAAERYTLHSDIWSLGCIMYELCAKNPPFNAKTHFHLVQKIKLGRVEPLPNIYSPELQKVISNCLKTNPLERPDTAQLLNLPVVRLMRKEREIVEVAKLLRTQEEQALSRAHDAELKLAKLTTRYDNLRAEVESSVRREWEVKARLEIDRQIQTETEKLRKKFESEVRSRVDADVLRHLHSLNAPKDTLPSPPPESQQSSVATDASTSYPSSTDLSSLSLDSPSSSKANSKPIPQPRKSTRTPFSRARTQYDSPMDVQMSEPSPMSIASLSLSPRRTAAAAASSIPNSNNIFAAAAAAGQQKSSKLTTSPSNSSSLDPSILEDDEEDDHLLDLPSPTRLPSSSQDPFKLPPSRPGLMRQNTAPTKRLTSHPPLFSTNTAVNHAPRPARIPSPTNVTSSGSPVRKAPPKPVMAGSGENDMARAVMQKNFLGNVAGTGGRTLVELQQARAGGRVVGGGEKMEVGGRGEVVVWDPERDEMPSPFLVRGGRGLRRL